MKEKARGLAANREEETSTKETSQREREREMERGEENQRVGWSAGIPGLETEIKRKKGRSRAMSCRSRATRKSIKNHHVTHTHTPKKELK